MEKYHINLLTFDLNLKKEYHLYQISDSHLVYTDNDKEKNWFNGKKFFSEKYNEPYTSYFDNHSSVEIFNGIIDYVNKKDNDLVILSGDIIDYVDENNIKILNDSINKIKTKTLFVCGNHDYIEGYVDDYQSIDFEEFTIVGVNNYNKTFNKHQIDKLKEDLKKDKPIIVVCHIPIITKRSKKELNINEDYFFIDYDSTDKDTKEFIDLLVNNKEIKGVLCGHCHGGLVIPLNEELNEYILTSSLIGYFREIIIK